VCSSDLSAFDRNWPELIINWIAIGMMFSGLAGAFGFVLWSIVS
jgi:hypothetical protein